jgi:hypothetical protein
MMAVPLTGNLIELGYGDKGKNPKPGVLWRDPDNWKPRESFPEGAMMGYPTGYEAFVVDLDEYKADAWEEFERTEPDLALKVSELHSADTLIIATQSGGKHVYFKMVDGITNAGMKKDVFDIRGLGGYAVHPDSPGYTVIKNPGYIGDAPEWLIERLVAAGSKQFDKPLPARVEVTDADLALIPERHLHAWSSGVPEHVKRHAVVFAFMCDLARAGVPIDAAYRLTVAHECSRSKRWSDANVWRQVQVAYAKVGADSDFWRKRKYLTATYYNARRRRVAPWALLGVLITEALHALPYNVTLSTVKGPMSMNFISAYIGPSGTGKSLAQAVAAELFTFGGKTVRDRVEPGSGEGILGPIYGGVDKDGNEQWGENHAVGIAYDEISSLANRTGRGGSTIIDYLKIGWSGGALSSVTRGDKGMIGRHQYRMTTMFGAQPELCDVLFDKNASAGGLTQRIAWFSVVDPERKSERDDSEPRVYNFPAPSFDVVWAVKALPEMNAAYDAHDDLAQDGKLDPLDTHELMVRSKIAVALMAMDGRTDLISEDWQIAGTIIEHSKATRQGVLDALSSAKAREDSAKGQSLGLVTAISEQAKRAHDIARVSKIARAKIAENPAITRGALRAKMRGDDRKSGVVDEVLDEMFPEAA